MAQVLETQYPPSQTTTNPAMIHVLQQHRDHLYEYSRERDKMKVRRACLKDFIDFMFLFV